MPERKWDALGKKIEPAWSPERDRAARVVIQRRATRRRALARVGGSVLALVLVAGGVGAFAGLRKQTADTNAATPSASAPLGVMALHLSAETVLERLSDRHGFILRSGGAKFTVPRGAPRPFVVVAGDLVIEDIGTTFTVQYLFADKVSVGVEEGRVKVRGRGVDTEIGAGERQEFTLLPAQPAIEGPSREPPSPAPSSWRRLAESGRYDEARNALRKAGPGAVRDEAADLLLAAD